MKLSVFLLAGAIINVAVAWALMFPWVWREMHTSWPEGKHVWPRSTPQHWPDVERLMIKTSPGIRIEAFKADKEPTSYDLRLYLAGWPTRSLFYEMWSDLTYDGHRTFVRNTQGHPRDEMTLGLRLYRPGYGFYSDGSGKRLPIKPLWPGFAINTIFYAAIVWMLFAVPGAVRRRVRIQRGQCASCGYSLRDIASVKCPECGATA